MAFCLHSSITSFGIIFITIEIPAGTIIRSSICPKTGMKSGMRSIGLIAYPMIKPINAFAYQGTRGSLQGDMLPPLKGCGLPASANTRWILRQAFIRLCPSLFRICANPARLYVSAGVRRSLLHDQLPTGLRLATVKRKRDLSVTLAFIPPLKGVGIPARNLAK